MYRSFLLCAKPGVFPTFEELVGVLDVDEDDGKMVPEAAEDVAVEELDGELEEVEARDTELTVGVDDALEVVDMRLAVFRTLVESIAAVVGARVAEGIYAYSHVRRSYTIISG